QRNYLLRFGQTLIKKCQPILGRYSKPMNERRDIEIKKAKNQFRKDARIKECFHFDSGNCSNEIISAHSIQRGNVLEILEHEVDGNKAIYSFLHLKHDIDGKPIGFEPLGKKIASTFFGF